MFPLVTLVVLSLLGGIGALLVRRIHLLEGEVDALSETVGELTARLGAAERDAASAVARVDVAESVLLDKGLADEEDLEAARARSSALEAGRDREGDLH